MSREAAYEQNPVLGTRGGKPISLREVVDAFGWDDIGILSTEARRFAQSLDEAPPAVVPSNEAVVETEPEVVAPESGERPRPRRRAAAKTE